MGAFAALRLRPRRLLVAVSEALKEQQQPSALGLMGPWESVIMVWAMGRLLDMASSQDEAALSSEGKSVQGHAGLRAGLQDSALWTLLQDRASSRVST